jgi:hypothetical protein
MLTVDQVREVYSVLREVRDLERPRLELIRAWLRNQVDDIYVPADASDEYRALVAQAKAFSILPLVVTTVVQGLFVDGYRPTGDSGRPASGEQSPLWELWQRNRMDARQVELFRPVVSYGTSFATVLPAELPDGSRSAKVSPLSPWRCTALYAEDDDEWPVYAMTVPDDRTLDPVYRRPGAARLIGPPLARIFDATHVYVMAVDPLGNPDTSSITLFEHGLGVCPVVRFRKVDDDGSVALGKVEPLLSLQRQINQTSFGLLMAQHYSAFRQRWATGMTIEQDEHGNVRAPWVAAVNRVWQNESPDGRFGDFAETNLTGYLDSRDKGILFGSSVAQVPPHNLLIGDGVSNIAAETLAALESAHQLDVGDHKTQLGESLEQVFRLAGLAMGDLDAWDDIAAEVSWRDTTPRSLGQIVDALGKMAAQLGIPVEALWTKIPGTTDQELARWKAMADEAGLMGELEALVNGPDTAGDLGDPTVPPSTGGPGGRADEAPVGAGPLG